ncbi:MAG: SMP-30/gluconolactonase/LRE family protein [Emcibacteraceae bacterium]|nr:SMP-30/gluconolactonase/LRE family protein [Emcibacteraceae bacterium]MDG1995780.1 SMP-30/gluconolactonase/LRE family protein [Emcibacteraceae bacterium]
MSIELIETVKVGNILGECVLWDPRTTTVWWTDIEASRIYQYDPVTKDVRFYVTPERLGSFGFTNDEEWLIAAFESGFAYYNPFNGLIKWIAKPQEHLSHIRFNDGRVDRQGRFWAGTMVENSDRGPEQGCLYRLDADGQATVEIQNVMISNSLCWSPDGKRMYFADSPKNRIDTYDFDTVSGGPSNKKFFTSTDAHIHPDGSTVDADGYLWNAQWGGSRIVRYTPSGAVDYILDLPVSQPTCVTFGGPDLSNLFVTTARADLNVDQLSEQPLAGDLLIYKTTIKGLTEPFTQMRRK